ncbi:MAG: hypothetical protein Q9220_007670 [cf. Caloplaca sp. 1 TL-2023]
MGCNYHLRPSWSRGLCAQPFPHAVPEMPWWEEWWNHHDSTNGSDTGAASFDMLMTNPLRLTDVRAALASQSQELVPGPMARTSLNKAKKVQEGIHLLVTALSDHANRSNAFSQAVCVEKDVMNYAIHNLAEGYEWADGSDFTPMTFQSAVLVAPWTLTGLCNLGHSKWLPSRKRYNGQVRAALQFQMKSNLYEIQAAVDRIIQELSIATNHSVNAAFREVRNSIDTYERDLKDQMNGRNFLQRTGADGSHRELRIHLRRLNKMRELVQTSEEIRERIAIDMGWIRSYAQNIRRQLTDDHIDAISSIGSMSSLRGTFRGLKAAADISTTETGLAMKQRCDGEPLDPESVTICLIYRLGLLVSAIDNAVFDHHPKSWIEEGQRAIQRYERKTLTDWQNVIESKLRHYGVYD